MLAAIPNPGRDNPVPVGGFIQEWWAASSRYGGRHNLGIVGGFVRNQHLGADGQATDLDSIRSGRLLLADPDPVPPLITAAAESLRVKLNAAHAAWETAWTKGEERLANDATWGKLTPEQKHGIRHDSGLLMVARPAVDTPQTIADALSQRGLSEWENVVKALPARIDDALAAAAALLEPKARTVALPGAMMKSEVELDAWLTKVRAKLAEALADGPVIPKV